MNVVRARARDWLGRQERLALFAMATVVLGTLVFFTFAREVMQGDTQAFDERVVGALRNRGDLSLARGPGWLTGSVRDVTALGSIAVIGLVSLAALGFAALRGNGRLALLILAAAGGGFLLNHGLKEVFDRPRPALPHVASVTSRSFPSGHAMVSAAVYLSIAALLATRERRRVAKAYILGVAILLTLLIGASRVYLGFHYPSDVVAGWLAGAIWAVLCGLAAQAVLRRT